MTSLASCWQRILPAHSEPGPYSVVVVCLRCRKPSWHGCARCLHPWKLAAGAGYLLAVLSAGMVQSVRAPWVVAALAPAFPDLDCTGFRPVPRFGARL